MVATTECSDYPAGDSNPGLREQCQAALATLERVIDLPPREIGEGEAAAESLRAATRLRDSLIDLLRSAPHAAEAVDRREALVGVNTALSLIARGEYPRVQLAPAALEDARDIFRDLLERGLS